MVPAAAAAAGAANVRRRRCCISPTAIFLPARWTIPKRRTSSVGRVPEPCGRSSSRRRQFAPSISPLRHSRPPPKPSYCFELTDGDLMFGSLVNLNAETAEIDSPRFGRLQVAAIANLPRDALARRGGLGILRARTVWPNGSTSRRRTVGGRKPATFSRTSPARRCAKNQNSRKGSHRVRDFLERQAELRVRPRRPPTRGRKRTDFISRSGTKRSWLVGEFGEGCGRRVHLRSEDRQESRASCSASRPGEGHGCRSIRWTARSWARFKSTATTGRYGDFAAQPARRRAARAACRQPMEWPIAAAGRCRAPAHPSDRRQRRVRRHRSLRRGRADNSSSRTGPRRKQSVPTRCASVVLTPARKPPTADIRIGCHDGSRLSGQLAKVESGKLHVHAPGSSSRLLSRWPMSGS